MKKMNYLGLLSLLSLIAILGWQTGNTGLYGFFGSAYYIRYFWVIPDELFQENVRKSATFAFFAEMISLVPLMFICATLYDISSAIPMAFGLSFAIAILMFTVVLMIQEWEERKGAQE